jgi:hypothetical protein
MSIIAKTVLEYGIVELENYVDFLERLMEWSYLVHTRNKSQ